MEGGREGGRERKGKEKWPGGFYPRENTPYWLCCMGIFLAVRCNQKLF
jgi:hypothetical protein